MNKEIARLLSEGGVSTRVGWQDVIVVQNIAPTPPPAGRAGVGWWNRGFNLVVLDRGSPEYFCKCRAAGDAALERDTRTRICLAQSPSGSLSVPPARGAASERIAVQVSPFVRGSHLGRIAPKQSTDAYLETVRTVLEGAGELADFAQSSCTSWAEGAPSVDLAASARESLEYLSSVMPLDGELFDALSAALSEAGSVPSRPQHGDLWWRNLLLADGRLFAIDLEDYGTVQVPLYDDLTLLSSTVGLRRGQPGGDLERLAGSGAEMLACRRILGSRARSEGLHASQLDGVLAYYVVHRASTVHGRAGSLYGDPHLDNVRYVAGRLANGERMLLFGD